MRGTSISFVVGLTIAAFACGDDGPNTDPATVASAQAPCTQLCEANMRCLGGTDPIADCIAECQNDVDGWARQDALEVFADCIADAPCQPAPDSGVDEDACIAKITVLDVHREWNAACTAQIATCDAEAAGFCEVEGEDGFVRIFAPVVVEEMITCTEAADCAARFTCLEMVFNKYGVDA